MANDFWKDIEKQGLQKAKQLANEAADELMQKALEQTYEFYNEYNPVFYKRHAGAGTDNSGLARSIERICKSNHGRSYEGGIKISADHMYKDYSGTPLQVLTSYLDGFHGLPTFDNYLREINETKKFKQLERYRNSIIKRFK